MLLLCRAHHDLPAPTTQGALERAAALAEVTLSSHSSSAATLEWARVNLRAQGALEEFDHAVHLVHGCRFLDRRLLQIVRDRLLVVGGVGELGGRRLRSHPHERASLPPPYRSLSAHSHLVDFYGG